MRDPDFASPERHGRSRHLTRFEDGALFFLLLIALGVIAIAIYLFIPKVQHFTYDPGTGKAYRQWTYGTVDVVEPGS